MPKIEQVLSVPQTTTTPKQGEQQQEQQQEEQQWARSFCFCLLFSSAGQIDAFFRDGGNNFQRRQFAGVARVEQRETPKESGKTHTDPLPCPVFSKRVYECVSPKG